MAIEETLELHKAQPHVIVVDDDQRIRELLSRFLLERGYIVLSASSAKEARDVLQSVTIDIAIFDVMMPEETGFELAESLRAQGDDYPIVFLTALGDVQDRIQGFQVGGDDYISKPFEPEELALRLEAILRRTHTVVSSPLPSGWLRLGANRLNLQSGVLEDEAGDAIALTDLERELLLFFARRNAEVITREALMEHTDTQGERAVDVQIMRLRRKIETDSEDPRILQTVRGQGYVLRGAPEAEGG